MRREVKSTHVNKELPSAGSRAYTHANSIHFSTRRENELCSRRRAHNHLIKSVFGGNGSSPTNGYPFIYYALQMILQGGSKDVVL
jgi:hypothetical protein